MGVPAFFRWLADKFPKVSSQVIEEHGKTINGVYMPVDTTQPNPNGQEFDNLYLDMNGIIHPCCHPEDKPAPSTEDEMIVDIFAYIDRIVNMIRPRKILYMAIDGVAPRAKMNQQRSRRFRAAQLAEIERGAEEKVRRDLANIGQEGQMEPQNEDKFDSNCITPGTPFMAHLAFCLRYYIAEKQNNDPLWKNLKVILSDATVPGEGEHKVMEFIRVQRSRPEHNPNTTHVMYGLDADLIMLALGTHEPHFKVLREDVNVQQSNKKNCEICHKPGHSAVDCRVNAQASAAAGLEVDLSSLEKSTEEEKARQAEAKPYVFLHVNVLREYLEHALKFDIPGIEFDFERAVDDWVFMCFFVGNDFLPHLPSLEIREGAISTLSLLWKQCMPMMGGYMTHNGEVDLKRVQILVTELGKMEDTIFNERREKELRRQRNNKRRKLENESRQRRQYHGTQGQQTAPEFTFADLAAAPVNDPNAGISNVDVVRNRAALRMAANQSAAAALKAQLMDEGGDENKSTTSMEQEETRGTKRKAEEDVDEEEQAGEEDDDVGPDSAEGTDLVARGKAILEKVAADKKAKEEAAREREPDDAVRLWEPGWKERYYTLKFGFRPEDREEISDVVKSYCEGLCWVFAYYYKGCVSWSWYYPYHYAPMASDFVDIDRYDIKFDLSAPFKPFEQLMGVLPAASRKHIPEPFHHLMTDDDSPIIDFYPTDFEVDMDGKKWEWQGVVKLPFIDTNRLLDAMNKVYDQLSEEEQIRNSVGSSYLYVSESHKMYDSISTVYAKRDNDEHLVLDGRLTDGLTGLVDKDKECIPRSTLRSPLPDHGLQDIANDKSLSVIYMLPQLPKDHVFVTKLLRNVKLDACVLTFEDMKLATFEKIEQRRNQYQNQGWTPQIQHLEEYREYHNSNYPRRGGGRGGRGGGYYDGSRFPQQNDNFYNYNNQSQRPPPGQYYPNAGSM
ncbi:XRN 5'-3' exonuclease N-terminus-domain-containing protein [Halteromyces radiatus]|uniref:XRN 5'-3' exonuclease N-terminus-domain-containing protein n=1 Tax=Halteromyces radiatus TaxID=101107 RepID=UPI00221F4178|nr:XRN 5'-3' exonuclease N-terminus-domain-containing protein [Halteromyces radiatus]KAI8086297.1 XRN 5'-3' exonuclease N-terminus-domain-containing protein [Halteromyces radiatus]